MKKLPRIAIVGFPNVGKSTLFNRLVGAKKSLVHALPGMTRDWVSAEAAIGGREVILVDTGGFFDSPDDPFSEKVKEKAWEASVEADIIIYVFDGKRGPLPGEEELYLALRKLDKTLFCVINKIDSPRDEFLTGEYHRFSGSRVFALSAEHKINLDELEAAISEVLPEGISRDGAAEPLKIGIVGRINVGKSSLVNRFCGQEKLIVSELPGTTRDSTDTLITRNKKPFLLVDTAGIRKLSRVTDNREKAGIIKAKKDILRADVICLVMDALEFPTRQDTAIAHLAFESGKPLVLAINKWDLVTKDNRSAEAFKQLVFRKLDFVSYAPLILISAETGQRVVKILDIAEDIYEISGRKVPTAKLNAFLAELSLKHPPLSQKGHRIKIKYMTQTRIRPPGFTLFTHSRVSLAPSYQKHLANLLRERFGFKGSPVRIFLRRN